jgi:2-polyprenyl-3-methyl-5-hydroxy-6-metoxy-1,4-benzoquinol methylase
MKKGPNSMALEFIGCPLCGDRHHRAWGRESGFDAVKCLNCGFVFVNPRPSLADITEANKIGEHRTSDGDLNVVYRRSHRKISYYGRIVGQLFAAEIKGPPLSWLDIGAGYGEFVEALTRILPAGSRVEGIEPMRQKVNVAQRMNIPISTLPLASVDGRFDVVSLMNVFSHLPDFDAFLRDIRRVMNVGGVLFLETGNGGDLEDASQYPDLLYLPDHLAFAGMSHVKAFLQRNGFDLVTVHEHRLDTIGWMTKNAIKRLIGRKVKLAIPYCSSFRTVFFKARLGGKASAMTGASMH